MTQQNKWATWQQLESDTINGNEVNVVISYDPATDKTLIVDNIVVVPPTDEVVDPLTDIDSEVTEPILVKKANNKKNKEA